MYIAYTYGNKIFEKLGKKYTQTKFSLFGLFCRTWGIFRLSDPHGIKIIQNCQQQGFHPHEQPSNGSSIYEHCGHVLMSSKLNYEVVDLRWQVDNETKLENRNKLVEFQVLTMLCSETKRRNTLAQHKMVEGLDGTFEDDQNNDFKFVWSHSLQRHLKAKEYLHKEQTVTIRLKMHLHSVQPNPFC